MKRLESYFIPFSANFHGNKIALLKQIINFIFIFHFLYEIEDRSKEIASFFLAIVVKESLPDELHIPIMSYCYRNYTWVHSIKFPAN